MSPRPRRKPETRYDPDYVVAPGETLREWLETNGLTARTLAAGCGPREHRQDITERIQGVLDRKPLDGLTALVLSRGTGISVGFWVAFEHNYRTGLAAGKKDTSE